MSDPRTPVFVDELLACMPGGAAGLGSATAYPHSKVFWQWLTEQPKSVLEKAQQDADLLFRRVGITFNVYGDEAGAERLIPFDLIPRILPNAEWKKLERGLVQRVQALNAFLQDIYSEQRILDEKKIPKELILGNEQYRKQMQGVSLPRSLWAHIAGVDLVRAGEGFDGILHGRPS